MVMAIATILRLSMHWTCCMTLPQEVHLHPPPTSFNITAELPYATLHFFTLNPKLFTLVTQLLNS